jgi:hypothetical protein
MWKCDNYDEEGYEACEEAYYEAMDRKYDQFKDDMCTESYEDNCACYGKGVVDAFLKKGEERDGH